VLPPSWCIRQLNFGAEGGLESLCPCERSHLKAISPLPLVAENYVEKTSSNTSSQWLPIPFGSGQWEVGQRSLASARTAGRTVTSSGSLSDFRKETILEFRGSTSRIRSGILPFPRLRRGANSDEQVASMSAVWLFRLHTCAISLINKGRLMAFRLLLRFPSDDRPVTTRVFAKGDDRK
jgi:hypothetical protein